MKLSDIFESAEKNLIGLTIDDKIITDKTPTEKWEGNFYCHSNKLTSLEGAPSEVGGGFDCYNNQLTSLKGAPSEVGGDFYCDINQLTSLEGIHKILKKMDGGFYASKNPIKSHVLGILLIPGCKKVQLDNRQVEDILNNHLPNTSGNRGLIECQSELLDANLDNYAEL